jgi:formate dehydrogenase iron-sulfur subunit
MRAERKAMWLDMSRCIGCRACQVACREWNQLPAEATTQTGTYQNPPGLSGDTWKQVKFLESSDDKRSTQWLFYSDSCKHCFDAPCMTACPTGAIGRTADGVIRVDEDVCNGNGHCVPACPYGVIEISKHKAVAQKCTMCEDRLDAGREPACAQVCPTDCIEFGPRLELLRRAHERRDDLQRYGHFTAQLYGEEELGGLGVFYLLMDVPSTYGLPEDPVPPADRVMPASFLAIFWGALALALAGWTMAGGGA